MKCKRELNERKKEEQSTNPWLAVGGSFPCCFFVLVCFIFIKLQVKWKKWNGTREFNEKKHKPKNKDNRGTNHSLCCRTKSAKKWNHASVPLLYTSLYFIPLGFYLQHIVSGLFLIGLIWPPNLLTFGLYLYFWTSFYLF